MPLESAALRELEHHTFLLEKILTQLEKLNEQIKMQEVDFSASLADYYYGDGR